MNYLAFEDEELSLLIQAVNASQMFFHPRYAPDGVFSVDDIFELQKPDKDILIIADKNFVSPICEIVKTGTLKDADRLQRAALFVTWVKFLNASATCGIGLLENDTAGLSTISGEESRQMFLHGLDKVPSQIWKDIAFGYRSEIPQPFLFDKFTPDATEYKYGDGLHLLSHEAAIIKIVELLRTPGVAPVDKFDRFMRWYADHLDIAESIMVYAAMVFGNVKWVSKPKSATSDNYEKVVKGIKNQAWDITYITTWSTEYYNETENKSVMFATDDRTQKVIVVNILPQGQAAEAVDAVFSTKAEAKKLEQLATDKFGTARVRPFVGKSRDEQRAIIRELIDEGYEILKKMIEQ